MPTSITVYILSIVKRQFQLTIRLKFNESFVHCAVGTMLKTTYGDAYKNSNDIGRTSQIKFASDVCLDITAIV